MTYQELAHRITDNDCEIAFATFYKQHRYWVYRSAIKMLHCPFDSDEAVNSVFAHIWSVRKRYDSTKGAWLTWVGIVAERFLWNAYRNQQREKAKRIGDLLTPAEVESDRMRKVFDTHTAEALDALVISEQILKLEDVLCEMPSQEQRLAWILRHVEGYTYKMIGKVIRRSEVVSQRRVKNATAFLKAYLTD